MTSTRSTLAALLVAVAALAGCSATSDTGSRTIGTSAKTTKPAATTSPADAAVAASEKKYNDAVASAQALVDAQKAAGPTKADYTIKIKTLSKECFGSAGCNVEARLTVSTTSGPATEGVPVELTVSVTGDEDGPQVETIELDEDGQYYAPEVVLSTKSSKTKVKATITAVEVTN